MPTYDGSNYGDYDYDPYSEPPQPMRRPSVTASRAGSVRSAARRAEIASDEDSETETLRPGHSASQVASRVSTNRSGQPHPGAARFDPYGQPLRGVPETMGGSALSRPTAASQHPYNRPSPSGASGLSRDEYTPSRASSSRSDLPLDSYDEGWLRGDDLPPCSTPRVSRRPRTVYADSIKERGRVVIAEARAREAAQQSPSSLPDSAFDFPVPSRRATASLNVTNQTVNMSATYNNCTFNNGYQGGHPPQDYDTRRY